MVWRPHNFGGSEEIEPLAYHSEARQKSQDTRSCGRPKRGNPFIRANGDVSVCCFDFNHNLVVGNLNEAPLQKILVDEKLRNVQRVHDELNFEGCGLICESCDQIQDRSDALLYSSDKSRKTDQPTSHSDHDHQFVERPLLAS